MSVFLILKPREFKTGSQNLKVVYNEFEFWRGPHQYKTTRLDIREKKIMLLYLVLQLFLLSMNLGRI